jgi:hypothetical protein
LIPQWLYLHSKTSLFSTYRASCRWDALQGAIIHFKTVCVKLDAHFRLVFPPAHNDQQLDFAFTVYQTTGDLGYKLSKEFKKTFAYVSIPLKYSLITSPHPVSHQHSRDRRIRGRVVRAHSKNSDIDCLSSVLGILFLPWASSQDRTPTPQSTTLSSTSAMLSPLMNAAQDFDPMSGTSRPWNGSKSLTSMSQM